MHTSEIRPIFRARHQSGTNRILPHILPLLRIVLAIAQPMMKSASLKNSRAWMRFSKTVFPETDPTLNREFQIARRAEQMQMIGHQKIITDEPCCCGVLPDVVQSALNRSLCQPLPALLSADREENPIRSAERNVNTFLRRAASRAAEEGFAHGDSVTQFGTTKKILRMGRAAALPYPIQITG